MEEYKPNSHRYKEEQRRKTQEKEKVEKVISGTAKTKKRRSTSLFAAEDFSSVMDYVLMDVLIPAAKNTISDIIENSVNMLLFGNTKRTSGRSNASYVSYRNYYEPKESSYRSQRTAYEHKDIILETRSEAEEVLDRMTELLDAYGYVSIADMYDLVGVTCEYTDNKYGWTNLRNAEAIRVRDGYLLKLPKVTLID